jgi:4,5-DOPA dioxygenase extradiol
VPRSTLMPAAFLGHGSPMNTLDDNRYTRAWREFGAGIPRPRAILVISAHWYVGSTAVTAMATPRTIHDFFGFPDELFKFEYPAPGDPALAGEIVELVKPRFVGLDRDSWGLDHGGWSVLAHVFPAADVPVLQLSINALQDDAYHLDIARRLAPLRDRGVLILASGNVVHNLRRLDMRRPDDGFDWAVRFDTAAKEIMTTRPGEIGALRGHPDFAMAAPTDEHYVPLLYLAGLAEVAGEPTRVLIDGYFGGAISMTSYTLGLDAPRAGATRGSGSAVLPDPGDVPPDDTNT